MNQEMMIQGPADIEAEVPAVVSWARGLSIQNPDDYSVAGERLKQIKGMAKRITEFFKPMKQRQDEAKRALLDAEKKLSDPLDEAEGLAKRAMLTYQQAQQQKAEAERRRLQAIADEQARKEREKAEQEAARQRQIESEARAKAEQARIAAQQADAADRRRLLAEADAADRKAAAAAVKVETQTENAAIVAAPVIQVSTAAPAVKGIATKTVWKHRVIDALNVPREYLMIDESKLS